VRDYLHIKDLTNVCLKILKISLPTNYEILNLGTGVGHSVFEVIDKVETYTYRKLNIVLSEKRLGDSAILVANPYKTINLLKWQPLFSLDQIITNSIESFN
jgi:UDP-glucose 4-epimerase